MVICERCGIENPAGFRFCGGCGAALNEAVTRRQTRKVVTALFCDVTGSTALGEELDPEVLRGVLNRYFAEIQGTIERHGGTVEKFIGDAVMAVFGIPIVHEDDALRAVRAAVEIRERLPAVADEVGVVLRFRTGINTGPVVMGEGGNLAVGDAVNVAARLEQAAAPGEIVLGGDTVRLVRDAVQLEALEPLMLKGKSEPVEAFRLLAVDRRAAGLARHMDARLVGRTRELRLLSEAWERAAGESGCHLFTLLGAAGVGKSRLVGQLLSDLGGQATVLHGRCLPYGEGITFWPLVEALMPLGERAQQVLEHLDRGRAATAEELFWEVRRLIESVAADRPLILSVDDLQWAQPMLLDLIDHVVDLSRGAPMLLLCTARPELLEERPGWAGGKLNATTVLLEPLSAGDSEALVGELGDDLDPNVRAQVIAASQGNPLFLEEMVALARERGTVSVPPTIQALLAARLERLGEEERDLLERGAVEGEVFHRLALSALAEEPFAAGVESGLAGLVRKELIRPHPATFGTDEAFRFRHLLIRDAAYDGIAKGARAELHERFAGWLEGVGVDLVDLDEIVGWHLEQAVRYQLELGRQAPPVLAERAARRLHSAGRRAAARSDHAASVSLLERALKLAPASGPLHTAIAVDLAEQEITRGNLARAGELLSIAEQDPQAPPLATLVRLEWLVRTRPEEATRAIESALPELLERLTEAGDERGLAKAHITAYMVHWLASRATPAAEEARLASEHARNAADEALRSFALGGYLGALNLGPANIHTIVAELDSIERGVTGPWLEGLVKIGRAWVARLEGNFDDAVGHVWSAIECFEVVQSPFADSAHQIMGQIHLTAGDLQAAEISVQRVDATLAAQGEHAYRSTVQAILADVSEALGKRKEADAAIQLSDSLSADEDVINYAITHRVRARLALADGDGEAAERWARSAVRFADLTDFVLYQAEAKLELARILMSLGQRERGADEARSALALQEMKGDRPGSAKTRAFLEEIPV